MSDAEYGLILPFFDDSESFTLGFECGSIDGRMIAGENFNATVHSKNKAQIEAGAKMRGYTCTWAFLNDDWLNLSAEGPV